jgi:hypothetical protein
MNKNYGRWLKLPKSRKPLLTERQSDAISDFRMNTIALLKKYKRRNVK